MESKNKKYPRELKELNQWLTWQAEGNKKVPYTVIKSYKASTTDPETWTTFDAVNSHKRNTGFVLTENDPYVFIDLDKVIENGKLKQEFRPFVDCVKNAYIAKSHSGTGLHIIVKGMIPKAIKTEHIEIYSQERFIALTGNAIRVPREIGNGQKLIQKLFAYLKIEEKADKKQVIVNRKSNSTGISYKLPLSSDIYSCLKAINNANHGELVRFVKKDGTIKEFATRSEADGYVLMHLKVAGYTLEDVIPFFKQYNKGTWLEDGVGYIRNYWKNIEREYWSNPVRQQLKKINVYNIELDLPSRQKDTAYLILEALNEFATRFATLEVKVSHRDIAMLGNMSPGTVNNGVKRLAKIGLINIIKTNAWNSDKYKLNYLNRFKDHTQHNNESVYGVSYLLTKSENSIYKIMQNGVKNIQQLQKITGKCLKTLQKALNSLIDKGLIELSDDFFVVIKIKWSYFRDEVLYLMSEKLKRFKIDREMHRLRMQKFKLRHST